MIVYFLDRHLTVLGHASTELPKGLTITDDLRTEDIETGVSIFEFKLPFDQKTRAKAETWAEVGNYILRSHDNESELYQIIESEPDTKKQRVYVYAEDDGMDLLNEVVGEYEADKAYPITHYIKKYASSAGFQIGINEAEGLTRKLSWDGESTAAARISSVATQFDGCEISYSFQVDGLNVVKKFINIYKERGKDIGITLRLNQDIDSIITTKSIANLATALQCTGGTPDDDNFEDDVDPQPITLAGYAYDDGDFYVDGTVLKSRKALEKWSRLLWKDGEIQQEGNHITKLFSYDTLSKATLCAHAITELKKIRDMEVNYDIDIKKLPDNVQIGDRVNIVDDAGELYLSTRILILETSVCDQKHRAVLGEHLIKTSGISQKVADLAAEFAKLSVSAARALSISNNAKAAATAAQEQANQAVTDAANAQAAADQAQGAADQATQSAQEAQEKANNAQAAVDNVEEDVAGLQTSVDNAQKAADLAQQAAETADQKAVEAQTAAHNAQAKADEADAAADAAQKAADDANANAATAQGTAESAKSDAETAQATADAAKLDAEQANKDIESLGENLTTLENTMKVDYARKTELTEAKAELQTQITQNAGQIETTAQKVVEIDETANNAAEQAQAAQNAAATAQEQADKATADAATAQAKANEAAQAAADAQSEADTAKAAANAAQSVADKAEADLAAAKEDLATVQGRVDATEEDIAAAEAAVATAQAAADKANADAADAANKAAAAQSTADTAVTNAATAQTAANNAASKAALAQQTADEAKGDASAAQTTADEAAAAAAEAQRTADTAKTNAATAQAQADSAAAAASAAQTAADEADAKAQEAANDLETAKQNLADVTSRVGATEEEVEAAQEAVEKAQAAADQANADAEAAQATADTAKANAAAAQTTADNAKSAADAAQTAADEAQTAADNAQAAVDALAVRVTSAETKITQNADKIELMATRDEVTETLGGYYTKEETDALIKLSADSIELSVGKTYATKSEVVTAEQNASNAVNVANEAKAAADKAIEEATVSLRIDSSRGTVFKNSAISTVLSAVIYKGPLRITDIDTLHSVFGATAYLEWQWQRMGEDAFGTILSSDSRIGNGGFTFTLSPEDVDTKVVFMCQLITD